MSEIARVMQSPSAPPRLISCDDLLALLRAEIPPLAPTPVPLSQLRPGLVAAGLSGPAVGLPAAPLALRAGYALRSDELIGATPQSPVLRLTPPPLVEAGETLPEGADAVLDPTALRRSGAFYEISVETWPGEGVLPAAHHLAPGAALLAEGEVIGPAHLLLLAMAGVAEVPCRIPRVAISGGDPAARGYLTALVQSSGEAVTEGGSDIRLQLDTAPLAEGSWTCEGLALNGLQPVAVAHSGAGVTIRFAPRPELLALVALALLLPLLDHLSRRRLPQSLAMPLSRKISSPVGMSEIILLRREGAAWTPLPSGEISLAALSAAEALLRIPAGEEGWAAGHIIAPESPGRRL